MKQDEQLFEKIENYLDGNLPKEEATRFEQQIQNDSKLHELVKMHRFEREGMEYLFEKNLKQKINSWDNNYAEVEVLPQEKKMTIRFILIGLMILASAFLFWWATKNPAPTPQESTPETETSFPIPPPEKELNPNDPPIAERKKQDIPVKIPKQKSHKKEINYLALAKENYELPQDLIINLRGLSPEKSTNVLEEGFKEFENKNFAKAILKFEKISATQSPTEYKIAQKYLAHAYFQVNDFPNAASVFQKLAAENLLPEEYEWFFTVSLLPSYSRNKKTIESMLNQMTDPEVEHDFAKQAQKLKSELFE